MARRKKKGLSPVYVVSLVAHLAIGGVLALVPQKKLREVVAIALNEPPPKDKNPEPPKPKPHPQNQPAPRAARAARSVEHAASPSAEATDAANSAAPVFHDLGLVLDAASTGGLAVRVAPPTKAPPPQVVTPIKPKFVSIKPPEPECTAPLVKAKPLELLRPTYTPEARKARVEGRVRIELAVNSAGEVTGTRVLDGLGYGLDEAALEVAKRLRFAPAMQCNRPVAAPFIIAMRFVLSV